MSRKTDSCMSNRSIHARIVVQCPITHPYQTARDNLFVIVLELESALLGCMAREYTLSRRGRDAAAPGLRQLGENLHNALRHISNQDFLAGCEDRLDARPAVANDRYPCSRGFKQTHAGGEPSRHHIGPRDIERVALTAVEACVRFGRHMLDSFDVLRPCHCLRVAGSCYDEALAR